MSENFSKLLSKIDFTKLTNDEDIKPDILDSKPTESSEVDSKELATFQQTLWPWDSVRNKLK